MILTHTVISTKVYTKFLRQVAVAESVLFARGLMATELVCLCYILFLLRTEPAHVEFVATSPCLYLLI
jgi:hypothetical protein